MAEVWPLRKVVCSLLAMSYLAAVPLVANVLIESALKSRPRYSAVCFVLVFVFFSISSYRILNTCSYSTHCGEIVGSIETKLRQSRHSI